MKTQINNLLLALVVVCGTPQFALGDEHVRAIECTTGICVYVPKCITEECRKRVIDQTQAEIGLLLDNFYRRRAASPSR